MQTAARPGAASAGTAAKPAQGCYKCGQTGHWSRDCTAPQSQWIPRQQPYGGGQAGRTPGTAGAGVTPAAPPAGDGASPNENANIEQEAGGAAQQTAAALRKEKRKRPKLTLELLQGSKGLPDVLVNFPDAFRRQFKGRGHEASDLRRLLEMYKRWQDRVFPHGDFDAFICNLERLSGTYGVRHHVQEARTRMLKEVKDIIDPPHIHLEEDEQQAAGAAAGAAAEPQQAAAAGQQQAGEWDDDELLEMQLDDEHPELDDELMELLEEPAPPAAAARPPAGAAASGAAAAGATGAAGQGYVDVDEEVLELVEEDEWAAGQQAEGQQHAGQQAGGSYVEDEELLELVDPEEEQQAQQAGQQQVQEQQQAVVAEEAAAAAVVAEEAAAESIEVGGAAVGRAAGDAAAYDAAAAEEEEALMELLAEEEEDEQQWLPATAAAAAAEPADAKQQQEEEDQQQEGQDVEKEQALLPSQLAQPSPEFGTFAEMADDAGGATSAAAADMAAALAVPETEQEAELDEATVAAAQQMEASYEFGTFAEASAEQPGVRAFVDETPADVAGDVDVAAAAAVEAGSEQQAQGETQVEVSDPTQEF